jgi:Asp/Glu/hydantoin racemase
VLKLDTRFPRLPGDIGNPSSFNHPVIYETISGAVPASVITPGPIDQSVSDNILSRATKLQSKGVNLITTSCGFLSPLQSELSAALHVPVITSSLALLPVLNQCFGTDHVGIITFDAEKLTTAHLQTSNTHIEGLRVHDSLRITIEEDLETLDADKAESEVLDAITRLRQQAPSIRAAVLECTNLSPYKQKLRKCSGISVFDIVDAVHWMLESQ